MSKWKPNDNPYLRLVHTAMATAFFCVIAIAVMNGFNTRSWRQRQRKNGYHGINIVMVFTLWQQRQWKQECIPVGCVLPTAVAIMGVVSTMHPPGPCTPWDHAPPNHAPPWDHAPPTPPLPGTMHYPPPWPPPAPGTMRSPCEQTHFVCGR